MNLRDSVRKTARKANITEATVLTYGGGYASVMVGSSGRMIHGIKVVGGVPVPGEKVDIDYSTDVPVVRSRAGGSSAGVVNLVQGILGSALPSVSTTGTGATTDSPPPSSDWFFQAGWTFGTDGSITSLTGDTVIKTNGEIVLGTANDVAVMSSADATYRFWAGNAVAASAPFSVTKTGSLVAESGSIAGWTITSTQIYKTGIILDSSIDAIKVGASSEILLDGANTQILVGSSGDQILIDGTNKLIKSTNFNSGYSGFQIEATDGSAEFNNVTVRGTIRASVFNIGEITATAGTLGVWKSAAELTADATIPAVSSTVDIYAKNSDASPSSALFAQYDVIRIKSWDGSSVIDVWGKINTVTPYTGYSKYNITIKSGGSVNVYKGMAVADYGQSQDGYITQSADNSVGTAPNISIAEVRENYVTAVSVVASGSGYYEGDILTVEVSGTNGDPEVRVLTLTGTAPNGVATVELIEQGYDCTTGTKSTTNQSGSGLGCTINVTTLANPWDGTFLKARIGNMNGSYGCAVDRYGFAAGDYSSGNYMSYNAGVADGLVFSAGNGYTTIDASGLQIALDDEYQEYTAITWKSGAYTAMKIQAYDSGAAAGSYVMRIRVGDDDSRDRNAALQITAAGDPSSEEGSIQLTASGLGGTVTTIISSVNKKFSINTGTTGYFESIGQIEGSYAIRAKGAQQITNTGVGVEISWNSTYGRVLAYNRGGGGSYQPMRIEGSYVDLYDSNSLVVRANGGDLYTGTTGWTSYSGSSSITGWSSRTTTKIYYKRVGKTVFVYFEIDGTSDSTSTSFTLPHAAQSNITTRGMCLAKNASSWGNGSVIHHAAGSSTCTLYWYIPTGPWTASGTKTVYGHYHYQMA